MSSEAQQEYTQGQQVIPAGAQNTATPKADPTNAELQSEIDSIWYSLDQHGIRPVAPPAPQPPGTGEPGPGEPGEPTTDPEPDEWGVLAIAMDLETPTVALESASTTADAGTVLQIDLEFMTVTDADDPNNLVVQRGTPMSAVSDHAANASVAIGVVVG